jgi:hypothetical protein
LDFFGTNGFWNSRKQIIIYIKTIVHSLHQQTSVQQRKLNTTTLRRLWWVLWPPRPPSCKLCCPCVMSGVRERVAWDDATSCNVWIGVVSLSLPPIQKPPPPLRSTAPPPTPPSPPTPLLQPRTRLPSGPPASSVSKPGPLPVGSVRASLGRLGSHHPQRSQPKSMICCDLDPPSGGVSPYT